MLHVPSQLTFCVCVRAAQEFETELKSEKKPAEGEPVAAAGAEAADEAARAAAAAAKPEGLPKA